MVCQVIVHVETKFIVGYALSCKKGEFVAQKHDGIRDLLTTLTYKMCKNVEAEPQLQALENERFNLRTAVTTPEARLDIKAGGFWSRGLTAFFVVRVTHVISKCSQNKPTSTIFKEHENKKKRILGVEMGKFPLLVFVRNGGIGGPRTNVLETFG